MLRVLCCVLFRCASRLYRTYARHTVVRLTATWGRRWGRWAGRQRARWSDWPVQAVAAGATRKGFVVRWPGCFLNNSRISCPRPSWALLFVKLAAAAVRAAPINVRVKCDAPAVMVGA